ncbi:MAG: protein kinase [Planctomycetes bacterium]|nr:protein kinase [Planctomycetota bacterium]
MKHGDDKALGRTAVEKGLLAPGELEDCLRSLAACRARGEVASLAQILLKRGLLDARSLAELLREAAGLPPDFPSFQRYEVERKLGSGGMAVVYLARDRALRRPVALKVLRDPIEASDRRRLRFQREALAAARLSHPNLVTVYEAGEEDGRLYLAMEYVNGRPLDRYVADHKLGLEERVALLETIARGVHAAHEGGVIHRDLKPANILVTEAGEPKVVDFGLARLEEGTTALTGTQAKLGTPLYMAPEQIDRKIGALSPRTDVYALGVVLYELLTGVRPHQGESATAVFAKILREPPEPPRRLVPALPRELDAIVLACLETDPRARYRDAGALADDLARHLAGAPVRARPASWQARLWRRAKRNRAVLVWAVAALAVGVAGGGWAVQRAGKGDSAPEPMPEEGRTTSTREREAAIRDLEVARPALDRAIRYRRSRDATHEELVRRVDVAQAPIEEAIRLAPDLAAAHDLLGIAWELKGWPDKAEGCWRAALSIDPSYSPARFRLGRLLVARSYQLTLGTSQEEIDSNRPEAERLSKEAASELEEAMKSSPGLEDEIERAIAAAQLALVRKDGRALEIASSALARFGDGEGAEALHWIAGLAQDPADLRLASLDRAIEIASNFVLARFARASLRNATSDAPGALEDYDALLAIDPRFVPARINRAAILLARGDLDGALADAEAASAVDPAYGWAHVVSGNVRQARGDAKGAIEDYTQAVGDARAAPVALKNRGYVRMVEGDHDEARRDLEEAVRLSPGYVNAWIDLGALSILQGDPRAALADFEQALSLDPQSALAHVHRADARKALGDLEGAFADWQEAIRLDAKCERAWTNRGLARLAAGDLPGGLADLEQALQVGPRTAEASNNRGIARAMMGDLPAAIEGFSEAIGLDPRHAGALYNRGRARLLSGDPPGAIDDLQEALRVAPPGWGLGEQARALLDQARKK